MAALCDSSLLSLAGDVGKELSSVPGPGEWRPGRGHWV